MRLITSGLDETWEDRPPILDIMLLGIEQDRIHAEIAERKREAKEQVQADAKAKKGQE